MNIRVLTLTQLNADPNPTHKGTQNYHDDNVRHLWSKLDTVGPDRGPDGRVTREEFVNGVLSMPLHR